jgi:hypothetical protein
MPPYLASLLPETQFIHLTRSKPPAKLRLNNSSGLGLCQFCKKILSHDSSLSAAEKNTPNTVT